jgi:hypothetical protein
LGLSSGKLNFAAMKYFYLLFLSLIAFASCKKEIVTVSFDTNHEFDFTIESSTGIINIPFNVATPEIEVNDEGTYENNDTRIDKIQEARLRLIRLQITNPPSKTFSFLKHVYLYIKADGLDEVLFASKENIDNNTQILQLDLNDINFAPYLKAGQYTLRTSVVIDEALGEDVDVNAQFKFHIVATPLK